MDPASFHRLRLAVQENALPAGPDQVGGLESRLQRELTGSRLFDQVEVGMTSDNDQLVIGLCRCAPGVTPWAASKALERLWEWAGGERPWEAHSVTSSGDVVDLEGAMTVDDGRHYVTVHVVATQADQGAATAGAPAFGSE
jgi:hypothetical protein